MKLQNVKSGFNLDKINDNFQKIQTLSEDNILYRKPEIGQPNQMETDLDMNNHRIYNTTAPKGPYDLVRVIDVQEMGGTVVPGPPPPPAPAPITSDTLKIAVIGDSLAGQQDLFDEAWPAILERSLNSSGVDVQVKNFAINAYTYDMALNTPVYGAKTMVHAAIDYAPDVVIVALGANDSFRAQGQGNATGVIAEAKALFAAVRAGLPDAVIFYGSTTMYDSVHINLAAAQNRHILPAWWQKKTSGLLAGLWCKEMQTDLVAANIRQAMQFWTQLDNNVRTFAEVNGTIIIPLWKVARMGCVGPDGLHPMAVGHKLMHAAVRKFLQTNPAFRTLTPNLGTQGGGEYNDFDALFDGLLSNTGSEYALKPNPGVFILQNMRQFGPWSAELLDSWFYPSKGSVVSSNLQHNRSAPQVWMIRGSKPNTIVQVTGNETSWLPTNLTTDSRGDAIECGSYTGLPNGVYTLRYRVDDETYGPLSITVTGDESGGGTGDYANKDGSNVSGTWPINITGTAPMAILQPGGGINTAISWGGTSWAPRKMMIAPGWQFIRETGLVFRIFPINDDCVRFASGDLFTLGQNGTTFSLSHSGEFAGGAYNNYYVYFSSLHNRVSCENVLPVLNQGIYSYPGNGSFICLGRIHLNASGQMEDTDTHRGVCSAYNQAPRSLRIAPLSSDQIVTGGNTITVGSCRYTSCFPGANVDWSVFGQAGSNATASYSRARLSIDSTVSSTVGGDLNAVSSHSLRSMTVATGAGQVNTLTVRAETGSNVILGGVNGVQARGIIHHNY